MIGTYRGAGRLARAGLLLGATGVALTACGGGTTRPTAKSSSSSGCPSGTATVTAHGHASTQGPPDLLTLSLGVQTSAPTAAAALAENSTAAQGMITQLNKDGVGAADLQTSGLSIRPTYGGPHPLITGYQVTNTVTARIHDLLHAGTLIDNAAHAAGNAIQVNGMSFSIQDDSALASQARVAAVHQAQAQARAMAHGAGMRLGPLCSLSDQTSTPAQAFPGYGTGLSGGAGSVSAPIETGSQQVTADVMAVYRLRP